MHATMYDANTGIDCESIGVTYCTSNETAIPMAANSAQR